VEPLKGCSLSSNWLHSALLAPFLAFPSPYQPLSHERTKALPPKSTWNFTSSLEKYRPTMPCKGLCPDGEHSKEVKVVLDSPQIPRKTSATKVLFSHGHLDKANSTGVSVLVAHSAPKPGP
jgi:hypothetical protein